jgi:succinate dehydrogenase / fumarate reductase cytochrome b subunit
MAKSGLLSSSLAKKYAMAATGLFLCLFLVGHLVGNLQLFISGEAGREAFNVYAHFMVSNPAVKLLSYLTYLSILFHAVDGFVLTKLNRKARPVSYAVEKPSENSSWMSRNMMVLGTIMLVFIVVHMQNFWWQMHFGAMPIQVVDGVELHDLYTVVYAFFNPAESMALLSLALYVAAMFAVGFHLWHGFSSSFQSLGLRHAKYTPVIRFFGRAFAVVVPGLFAAVVVYIYLIQA